MELNEIYQNLINDKCYWNSFTNEVVYYDPEWDEEPLRSDRADHPTFCIAMVRPTSLDVHADFWDIVTGDDDILRSKAVMRIANEDGWVLMDPEKEKEVVRMACDLERDFYDVVDGHVELYGWMEVRDSNWEGFSENETRYVLVTGDWPEVYDPEEDMAEWACPYQQYNDDMHEGDAVAFVIGWRGMHLPLADVDESTPSGRYWCFFEED